MSVTIYDSLDKCLQIFISHHLRHLCVTNPGDGAVVGIITRKDLFEYVSL
jgi:CBS domain-containing protein